MAQVANDLNRAGDTPIATLRLMSIDQKNWRRFPPPVADMELANENAAQPSASDAADWIMGAEGNDVDEASATLAITDAAPQPVPDYAPRTQADKATQMGVPMAEDVGIDYGEFSGGTTRTGTVEPWQPYPTAEEPAP